MRYKRGTKISLNFRTVSGTKVRLKEFVSSQVIGAEAPLLYSRFLGQLSDYNAVERVTQQYMLSEPDLSRSTESKKGDDTFATPLYAIL